MLLRTKFEDVSYSGYETIEKSHGRIEIRKYTQFELTDWVDGIDDWSKLTTGIHVERIRDSSLDRALP